MKKKIDYKEQLKSPKWQKKRLEILKRDNFTCQIRGETERPLHVHHTSYNPGKDVWDYNEFQLITLCEDCHKEEHELKFDDISIVSAIKKANKAGITNHEIEWLLYGLTDLDEFVDCGHIQSLTKMRKRRKRINDRMHRESYKEFLKNYGREP